MSDAIIAGVVCGVVAVAVLILVAWWYSRRHSQSVTHYYSTPGQMPVDKRLVTSQPTVFRRDDPEQLPRNEREVQALFHNAAEEEVSSEVSPTAVLSEMGVY